MPGTGTIVGLIKALGGGASPAEIQSAVDDWLDDHPEATTTVQDGAITRAKLDSTVGAAVDDVPEIRSDLNDVIGTHTITSSELESGYWAYSNKANNSKRLRAKELIPVQKGMAVRFTNPTQKVYVGVLETTTSQTYLQTTAWVDAGQTDYGVAINYNGYMTFIVEDTNDITPEDYACTVEILYNDGKVDKFALENAGIFGYTYTTRFGGEFTVTTADTEGWLYPYASVSATPVSMLIGKECMYEITINGEKYILPSRQWFEIDANGIATGKTFEYVGNLNLYISDISGVPDGTDNVPFLIFSIWDLGRVLTTTAGTYTILVRRINNAQKKLPDSLIWGDYFVPLKVGKRVNGSYDGYSIGVNELKGNRGQFAFGYQNTLEGDYTYAIGLENRLPANGGIAIGPANNITANNGIAIGQRNIISGLGGIAEGLGNESSGNTSHAEGTYTVASGNYSHAQGRRTLADGLIMTALGRANVGSGTLPDWVASTSYAVGDKVKVPTSGAGYKGYRCKTANSDSTFDETKWDVLPSYNTVAVALGNGWDEESRSNALMVDWDGNVRLAGDAYVGCESDSTGGTKLATVNDICPTVTVTGATPSITGVANTRYICGTVTEITITPPQSGIIDVVFTAGSSCVLSLPNTVKLPAWFSASTLTNGSTYEINIMDGVYGAVMEWA